MKNSDKKGKDRAMNNWQGITWERGSWGQTQWQQLEGLLNSDQQFSWLGIQYPYLMCHPDTGQWYELPRYAVPDAHWYERAAVQRANYHEGLFSVFFAWQAGFSNQQNAWVWIQPPSENGEPVNAVDFNTLAASGSFGFPYEPSVLETSHGNLLRVGDDTICYPEYSYCVDPIVKVKLKGSRDSSISGGLFLVPPDYRVELSPHQVRFGS